MNEISMLAKEDPESSHTHSTTWELSQRVPSVNQKGSLTKSDGAIPLDCLLSKTMSSEYLPFPNRQSRCSRSLGGLGQVQPIALLHPFLPRLPLPCFLFYSLSPYIKILYKWTRALTESFSVKLNSVRAQLPALLCRTQPCSGVPCVYKALPFLSLLHPYLAEKLKVSTNQEKQKFLLTKNKNLVVLSLHSHTTSPGR